MKKLLLTTLCLLSAVVCSHAADLDEVLVIFSANLAPYRKALEGFKESLRGGSEQRACVEYDLKEEGGDRIVLEMASRNPSLVFVVGPEAAQFAKETIREVPVVFTMVLHALSFAGENSTGVSMEVPAGAKLREVGRLLPTAKRIGLIHYRGAIAQHEEIVRACREEGFRLVEEEIDSGEDLHEAFDALAPKMDLFLMVPDPKIYSPRSIEFLLRDGLKYRVPIIGLSSSYTRAGAIASFEPDYADLGRQAGEMAQRIAGGQSPRAIEPSRPRRIKTSINLVVAERLGIEVPRKLVEEASDVFR